MDVLGILVIAAILFLISFSLYRKVGFTILKRDRVALFVFPAVLTVLSLTVATQRIGGTVSYTSHGWPHFYLVHRIKDVVSGSLLDQWNFVFGHWFAYILSDYVFYLAVILFLYLLMRVYVSSGKKSTIGLIAILIVLAIPISASQNIKAAFIKSELAEANYCQTHTDCVDAGGKCPFGCYIYVNQNEADRIKRLLDSYHSTCVYGCAKCPAVECVDGKCREVCDSDSGADTVYQDDVYGFGLWHPAGLKAEAAGNKTLNYPDRYGGGEKRIDRVVTFSAPGGGPGLISVQVVEKPKASTTQAWLNRENKRLNLPYQDRQDKRYVRYKVEDKRKIAGQEAIIVHQESDMESHKNEKKAVFFHNGRQFTVLARGVDYERLWQSFDLGK